MKPEQEVALEEILTTQKSQTNRKHKRGFASMDKEKQRAIASKGGKAAHAKGTAHEFTQYEAKMAGRKGGSAIRRHNRIV